jgi:GNAT superfamily N-acetyltransferase
VLGRLDRHGAIATRRSARDGRQREVVLTAKGRAAFALLDGRSDAQIEALLDPVSDGQRRTLVEAMGVISHAVRPGAHQEVVLRGLRSGDLGWVVQRHGELYADEFGWDADFEGLVARIVADFQTSGGDAGHADGRTGDGGEGRHRRDGRQAAWIGEVDGVRAGCVLCCRQDDETAQLRLLLVEPWARGLGLGRRLVEECIAFARQAGDRSIVLWTNDVLVAARRIYVAAGFELVDEEPHHSFGHDLVGQHWALRLDEAATP